MKKDIELFLLRKFAEIGIDRPENFDDIVDFVVNDVVETRIIPDLYTSEDILIGLRRFIEQK